jgi:hypothetical protein
MIKRYKLKTGGGLGEGKSIIKAEGQGVWKERPSILWLCQDCYNFHSSENNDGEEIKEGSALDRLFAKHSNAHGLGITWKKHEKMAELWKKIEEDNNKDK